jgi:hypothetical protein
MTEGQPETGLRSHPAVRSYMLVGVLALLVMMLALGEYGLGAWCLLPFLLGVFSLVAFWGIGPPLLLISLPFLLFANARLHRLPRIANWGDPYASPLTDLTLCAALLTYVLAQYRLLAIGRSVFPPDPRRLLPPPARPGGKRRRVPIEVPPPRRSPDLVSSWEMTMLVVAVPVWTVLAAVAWVEVDDTRPRLGLHRQAWHAVLLTWAAVLTLGLVSAAASYLRRASASPEESLLYLQDQLWRETRREQSQLERWRNWARLRKMTR